MREIKFRAWDGKKMWESVGFTKSDLGTLVKQESYMIGGGENVGYTSSVELMQYTGLLDKNGVEIYEGDICLLPNGEKRFVRYDAPSFYLAKSDDLVDVDAFSTPGVYEGVIGNIYANPELLHDS